MNDCLPHESGLWQWVENTIREVVAGYGYKIEIWLMLFENLYEIKVVTAMLIYIK